MKAAGTAAAEEELVLVQPATKAASSEAGSIPSTSPLVGQSPDLVPVPAAATTAGGAAPQAIPLSYAVPQTGKWTVGTLTYTTGGLVIIFLWLLLGDFAFSMRERSAQSGVQLMMKKFGGSSTYMSIVLAVIPPAIGMILGPIVSYRSDRYRSKWGRRIPYLIITTPIVFLSMCGLSTAPMLGAWTHQILGNSSLGVNFNTLAYFAIFYTLFEFACIASLVLFGALVNDVVPRSVIGRFFGLFRTVSLGAGMIFNSYLLAKLETHFFEIFMGISLVFGLGFAFMCIMVREGEYPPPADNPDDIRARGFLPAAKLYLRECFKTPYYRWVFMLMLLAGLTFLPFNTFSIPYAQSLGMPMQKYGDYIAMSYLTSFILAYPLGWLVDKFHALRVGIATMAIYLLATTYGAFFVTDPRTFAIALVVHVVLSGLYFTATASLGQMLFPKLKFGQFASAAGIVASAGSILLGLVLGPVLDLSGNAYRLTFVAGLALCVSTLASQWIVHRHFMRLGGPAGYVPPEPAESPSPRGFAV